MNNTTTTHWGLIGIGHATVETSLTDDPNILTVTTQAVDGLTTLECSPDDVDLLIELLRSARQEMHNHTAGERVA